jgi:3-oxoacyl-[acyl-carrier-protein] synthase II
MYGGTGERRRVVVTGMGAVTPLGVGVDSFWKGCVEGRSGVGPITQFDASALPCRIAGEARDFSPRDYFSEKESKRYPRFGQMAIVSADQAIRQSGLEPKDWNERQRTRTGVVLGNGSGGSSMIKDQILTAVDKGWAYCDPLSLLKTLPDMAAAVISSRIGATGYISTVAMSCASGAAAIGHSVDVIRAGRADVVVTGGTEAWLSDLGIGSFALLRALTGRNIEPERASRPFDVDRDGFVPAEGAAMFVLEAEEHALERGAQVIGEVKGFAITSDAHHLVAPRPDGASAAAAIVNAIEDANIGASEIDYINAHGTSTPHNDVVEARAVALALGEAAGGIPVSATKSLIGHSLGASAAIETVVALKTIQEGVIHPTLNLDQPDARCELKHVRGKALRVPVSNALNISFAFGGQNACLVLSKYESGV